MAMVVLKINAFVSLLVPVETWAACNSGANLPEHVQAACEEIAQAILQALMWSM